MAIPPVRASGIAFQAAGTNLRYWAVSVPDVRYVVRVHPKLQADRPKSRLGPVAYVRQRVFADGLTLSAAKLRYRGLFHES